MTTLQQYPQVISFLEYLQFEKRYSQHTIISYQTDLEQFFEFLIYEFDSPNINNINAGLVRTWLAQLKENDNSSKTINRKISSLKSFFKYLMKMGELKQTPMNIIVSPKVNKRLPVFVEEKNMHTLFNHVEFSNDWKGKTEKLVLTLFYASGIRLSELINLKESQLDIANGQIKVLGKGSKERIIPIAQSLLVDLKIYIQEKHAAILTDAKQIFVNEKGNPLQARAVYAFVKKQLAQVTTIQKKSPHILRHSFATHLMNNGADLNAVKELLGHSSLAATQVYTHNTIEKLKEIFAKAHPKA